MTMRILLISPTFAPDIGGVETMLSDFCDDLSIRKYQVDVITYNSLIVNKKAPFKEKLNEFVTVWRIPWIGRGLFNIFEHYPPIQFFYLVPMLTLATLLFLLPLKKRPDIIHVFGLSGAVAGGIASRIFRIPSVADMCTVYKLEKRPILAWFVRRILNRCDYIRGNHIPGKDELEKIGIKSEKLGIITPPVDEAVFKPMPKEEVKIKLGLPNDKFIVLFVGRMIYCKGVDIAVAAARLVKSSDVAFVFVGEGPQQGVVEEAARVDKRIIYVGNVEHKNLRYYYNSADVLIYAAVDSGLISYVGREALMCGSPILSPNSMAYFNIPTKVDPSLIPQGVGSLIDPTPEAAAVCLEKLIKQKKENVFPFNPTICREFAIRNFSRQAMDWLGDSYDKARKIRFPNK